MPFNTLTFVIFFAIVAFLHNLPFSWKTKKLNLLVASYIFYAGWNPPFVVFLWWSTMVDWICAKGIYAARSRGARILWLILTLITNLGLLGWFKYGNFMLDNFVHVARFFGIYYSPMHWDIVLPVGISFYTFHSMSYTLDIYRGVQKPWPSFVDFALYVTFFPPLVAGPILRGYQFLPQLPEPRTATARQWAWGLSLMVVGLFQKMVLADGIFAPVAEHVFGSANTAGMNFLVAWVGTLGFAGQIFCDFAGYSTCAIGVALCLGFGIPDNFHYPYAAIGFSDFWQRWHISLSSWLRDYLYIPLGGNRRSTARTYTNLMLTMLIGGLWHGASWTFVAWGGLHGLFLVLERLARNSRLAAAQFWKSAAAKLLLGLATFIAVCFTWVFFRAETFSGAFAIIAAMVGKPAELPVLRVGKKMLITCLVGIACLVIAHWKLRDTTLEDFVARLPALAWACLLALMMVSIATVSGEERAFIYFQF
jgi:D-alanyl-lipoteichoic acid acyltransferase DltB (MBOAT superfamily)